jgi:hypothetical protein
MLCHETELCCLVAHHVNPRRKDFAISRAIVDRHTVGVIQRELKKCVCLCMNCHAKVHAQVLSLPTLLGIVATSPGE